MESGCAGCRWTKQTQSSLYITAQQQRYNGGRCVAGAPWQEIEPRPHYEHVL